MNVNNNDSDKGAVLRGWPHSLWIDTAPAAINYPTLNKDIEVDTAVIGGGIVGITTATLLKEVGHTVAIIEMNRIVKSVTGHTTAKVTALHGLRYHKLLSDFSEEQVRVYADANRAAVEKVSLLASDYKIACDLKRTSAFTYTESDKHLDDVKKEVEATQKLGIPSSFVDESPLPFSIKGAIRLDNQIQFHPRKYLLALAETIPNDGSHIFENTLASHFKDGEPCTVTTSNGTIKAKNIVLATTFPSYDTGSFFAKLYPYCAYAIGAYIKGDVPEGMYFTEDDVPRSIRNQPVDGTSLLIIGGGHHKTGQGGSKIKHFEEIERFVKDRFDVDFMKYYWSTEDYSTPDRVPYIGLLPKTKHIYMATGFGGWGMTNGTASAILIADLIRKTDNPWSKFFDPSRHNLATYNKRSISEGMNVVGQYAKEYLSRPEKKDLSDLATNEGDVIQVEDKKIAAYKDEDGKTYVLSPKCTHMGCQVAFNDAEKTWDCTCHGSRFNYDGTVIHGPALENLPTEPQQQ